MLGAAFAEALGDRSGICRFGEASVPMDESLATVAVDVGGRPYAVIDLPFLGSTGRRPAPPARRACARGVRPDGRRDAPRARHGPERPSPRRSGVQGARQGAPGRLRAGSAADRRRVDEGRARVNQPPLVAVVDYGAGNLVSIEQALVAVGARVVLASETPPWPVPTPSSCPASERRLRRWSGSSASGSSSRSAAGSPTTGRFSGSASGSSCCSRAATRTAP